jgi:hypothetical protein
MYKVKKKKELPPVTAEEVETMFEDLTNEHLTSFKERSQKENDRFTDMVDGNFYTTLVFQTGEQCREFCKKCGIPDGLQNLFLDGLKVAEHLGIEITSPTPPLRSLEGRKPSLTYLRKIIK